LVCELSDPIGIYIRQINKKYLFSDNNNHSRMKYSKLSTLFDKLGKMDGSSQPEEVVNITNLMAARFWGGDDPVGTLNSACNSGCWPDNLCSNINESCSNQGCSSGTNHNCTNSTCTSGASNTSCTNSSCGA